MAKLKKELSLIITALIVILTLTLATFNLGLYFESLKPLSKTPTPAMALTYWQRLATKYPTYKDALLIQARIEKLN